MTFSTWLCLLLSVISRGPIQVEMCY